MKVVAKEIRTFPWTRQDDVLRKDVILLTADRDYEFKLLFSLAAAPQGDPVPMTMLKLNFRLNPDCSQDEMWFGLRLSSGGSVGAAESFRCTETAGETMLVSVDKDVFSSFSSALVSETNWHLEVLGTDGVMAECPLTNTEGFYSEFMAFLESAKKLKTISGAGPRSDGEPQFGNPQEKGAYWNMVRDRNDRIFEQLDREERRRRFLIWGAAIAALAAFGYFFGLL